MESKSFKHKDLYFETLFYPSINHKGTVLIAPAIGITANYYHYLAIWLSLKGLSVLVVDYQGTGTSENLIKQPITFDDWINAIEISGVWLKNSYPNAPLFFVGHSMGSQLFGFLQNTELFYNAVFLASSTGYWKDIASPQRWSNYLMLQTILPFSNFFWGYTNAKFFNKGENYPKLIALRWRKWCLNKEYLKIDLKDSQNNNYNFYKGKITSIWFSDDPIANETTTSKLLQIYKNADTRIVKVSPVDIGQSKIGHTGFLSRKFMDSLWPEIFNCIN